ncbi:indole-2-monooxygenase-like [Panicum miliaceum]|uniref:Indole-2-monooxygenase-like n=1 Tax=Panicum miliaceum TaxID=4540 RepID=A0A3L6Q7K6_PANMI|nr:indole-2-monooxygenase-like [Panicum miliaceum]
MSIIAMASLAQQFMLELKTPRSWLLLLVPLFLLLVRYSLSTFSTKRGRTRRQPVVAGDRLPPSPPALPVLGHLHLVGSLPHVSLRDLARKHGYDDLMLLRLGAMPVLVVSSPRAAEAVLRTHDLVFASRPRSLVAEIVLYGASDIGFAPYGEYWRQARKLVTTHMLTIKRVQSLRLAREEEVSFVMAKIGEAAAAGAAVDMSDLVGSFINDLACRAVMGKSFRSQAGRNKLLRELIEDTSTLLGGFNVEEFFPFLARFGVLSKVVCTKSERLRRRWDELLDNLIEGHERKYVAVAASDSSEDDDDLIHVVLSVRQEYGLTREQMKAILLVSPKSY